MIKKYLHLWYQNTGKVNRDINKKSKYNPSYQLNNFRICLNGNIEKKDRSLSPVPLKRIYIIYTLIHFQKSLKGFITHIISNLYQVHAL